MIQIGLAIYLLPVLALLFMIGGLGIGIVGLAALAAKVWCGCRPSRGIEAEEDAFRS